MTTPAFIRQCPDDPKAPGAPLTQEPRLLGAAAAPDGDPIDGGLGGGRAGRGGPPNNEDWFIFQGQGLVIRRTAEGLILPKRAEDALNPGASFSTDPMKLGSLEGRACIACAVPEGAELREGYASVGLRALFGALEGERFAVAGYASQMVYWQRTSGFCATCGGSTEPVAREWSKRCTRCYHVTYPRVSPCVITLIHDGDSVLLTHKPGWGPMYSLVAGFVEPGESLEECLKREVLEEVGAEVDEIRYFGSQPWPFPHQLMVGFFARYRGGELRIDTSELDAAAWFHVDAMPPLPGRISIARQLLDAWITSRRP